MMNSKKNIKWFTNVASIFPSLTCELNNHFALASVVFCSLQCCTVYKENG